MDTVGKIDERNESDWKISAFDIEVRRETFNRGKYVIIVPKLLQQKIIRKTSKKGLPVRV